MDKFICWKREGKSGIANCELQEILDFLDNNKTVECDLETTGLYAIECDILSIQFGNEDYQYLIEWKKGLDKILKPYFESDILFLFVNAKFDLKFLMKYNLLVNKVYDCFLVEKIIRNDGFKGRRYGYDALVKRYIGDVISKEIRASIPELGLIPEVIDYSLTDVQYQHIIAKEQAKLVRQYNLQKVVNLENETVKALAYVEFCGIRLDTEKWIEVYKYNVGIRNNSLRELSKHVSSIKGLPVNMRYDIIQGEYISDINWDSPPQVIKIFRHIGIDVASLDDSTKDSVNAKILKTQEDKHPLIKTYLEYKKASHAMSSFGENYILNVYNETGRIHTQFNQIEADTGRMSCGRVGLKERSPNLQQVPAEDYYRACFIPESGNALICSDYSGQEAVIFANLCMDENLLEFYDKDMGDQHSFVASMCFKEETKGLSLKDIAEQRPDLRQLAKSAGFAINYGGNGYTISKNLGISQEEGDNVYNAYMDGFPGIRAFFDSVSNQSIEDGYVTCDYVMNRKFFYRSIEELKEKEKKIKSFSRADWDRYKWHKSKQSKEFTTVLSPLVSGYYKLLSMYKRMSYNYPCQSTAASMTKLALGYIYNFIVENNLTFTVKIVNVVHDEIILEAPVEMADTIAEVVKKSMEDAALLFCKRIPVKASPIIADHWVH